jgi:6-pyruvoyltetrahydropterin/6-carboxytetrahydropterin synthase
MLSKHPERCRYPHGHTRTIDIVVYGEKLDANGMLVDFTALKLAISHFIEQFDHAMVVNSAEPLLPALKDLYPEGVIVMQDTEPTTEVLAKYIFDKVAEILRVGAVNNSAGGATYSIAPNQAHLDRVRVWETPSSWAEYAE